MTSIRRRTATLVILSMFGLLAFGGAALFVVIRGAMTAQFDDALVAKAAALQGATVFDGSTVEMNSPSETSPQFAKRSDAAYFVAWVDTPEGTDLGDDDHHSKHQTQNHWRILEHSDSLTDPDVWPGDALRGLAPGTYDIELPDDDDGRVVLVEYSPMFEVDDEADKDPETPKPALTAPPTVRLAVAASRAALDRSLALIAWCIAGVCVAFAIASVVATRWAVTLGLSPLTDLSRRVQALGPDTLDTRLDSRALPAELRPIADGLNAMLARLDDAFQREQRFTAAASHELRTPIAELRMLLEVAASQPRSSEQWARTADTALGVLARAQSLSETLLRLSRAGSAHGAGPVASVADVPAIIGEQVQRSTGAHRAVVDLVRVEAPASLAAGIDAAALGSIIGNLLDNALRHGEPTPGSPVTVRAAEHAGRVHIDVANPAAQLTADDVPRLFEPFWQREASRTNRNGFGLGLAVARTLARGAGGEITASLDGANTLTVRVDVPAANDARQATRTFEDSGPASNQ